MSSDVAHAGGRTKKSQEGSWSKISNRVDRFIKEKPEDELATLITHLRGLDIGRWTQPNRFYRERALVEPFGKNLMQQFGTSLDDPFLYPDVVNKKYAPRALSPVRYLMSQVSSDTEAVIELGSGWSFNLFQIYIGLGRTRSKNLEYIGAEFTDSGRDAADKIAKFDGKIDYSDYPMDYRNPDVSFLEKYKKKIVVFTHHSIEQVDEIAPKLYEDLYNLNAEVTLIHFEPVGWQRDMDLRKARQDEQDELFLHFGKRFAENVSTERDQIENAAWWSWRLSYNKNLLDIIEDNVKSGRFEEKYTAYDYAGAANVLNPSSVFHLKKKTSN